MPASGLHHVELWVPDLVRARQSWGWLLTTLGWTPFQDWPAGCSWRCGATYLVVERSPALTGDRHERTRPGLNHLALHAPSAETVDRIVAGAGEHGWTPLFADRYPHAGGPDHYAGYLTDRDGYQAEVVAPDAGSPNGTV